MTQAYPLQWPLHIPRARSRRNSQFSDRRTIGQARDEMYRQLELLNASNVVVSANLRLRLDGSIVAAQLNPADPAIAVYFDLPKQPGRVIACDTYFDACDNLWAIAQTIDALRKITRYGVGQGNEQFTGYAALPAATTSDAWWQVLGLAGPNVTRDAIQAAWKNRISRAHPDQGGSDDEAARINVARDEGLKSVKGGE